MNPQLVCSMCQQPAAALDWRCPLCGGPLEIVNLPAFDPATIQANDWSLWRYAAMLPAERRFSLGEGGTPLINVDLPGGTFRAKLEFLNPTGSFKDRGAAVLVNHLLAQGVHEVIEDSSGNAGAALAAMCSTTGIHARIFVPAQGSPVKKGLIAGFGAELVEVDGPPYARTAACQEAAQITTYASHAWSPFFVAGQMTTAWEVWEQMGRHAPDAIVCPIGQGGLFLGFARGFRALFQAGLIVQMPHLYAVQSAGCDPIVQAWDSGATPPPRVKVTPSIADGIQVEVPVRGQEVLAALRNSGGAAFRVDNDAIQNAKDQLAQHGILVEPTSAVPVAALPQVREHLGGRSDIVIALTGNGLKGLTGK